MSKCRLGLLAVAGLLVLRAGAQAPGASLQFSLDREGTPPVQYTVVVGDHGSGVYRPHLPQPASATASGSDTQDSPQTLRVGPALVKKLFAAVPAVEGGRCETHNKGIARTGVKNLHYVAAGRDAQCTFNYSDDDRVNEATVTFQAIAETMRYGERLNAKLRFDRLGLDNELEGLESAAAAGRALEVGNIAPVLNAIIEDDRVMDRVRRRAQKLLGGAVPGQAGTDAAVSER